MCSSRPTGLPPPRQSGAQISPARRVDWQRSGNCSATCSAFLRAVGVQSLPAWTCLLSWECGWGPGPRRDWLAPLRKRAVVGHQLVVLISPTCPKNWKHPNTKSNISDHASYSEDRNPARHSQRRISCQCEAFRKLRGPTPPTRRRLERMVGELGASDGHCTSSTARFSEAGRRVAAPVALFVLLDWFVGGFIFGQFCLVDYFEKERP